MINAVVSRIELADRAARTQQMSIPTCSLCGGKGSFGKGLCPECGGSGQSRVLHVEGEKPKAGTGLSPMQKRIAATARVTAKQKRVTAPSKVAGHLREEKLPR